MPDRFDESTPRKTSSSNKQKERAAATAATSSRAQDRQFKNAKQALVALGFKPKEALQVLPHLFLYLFRSIKQVELKKRSALIRKDIDLFPFLSHIPLMGTITLHDKVCLYAMYKGFNPGVKPNPYLKTVLENPEIQRTLSKFQSPPYTVEEVQLLERRAVCNKEVMTYMGKFIFRKMSFLIKSYGVSKEDLVETMQERAIHNLRINYPNWKTNGEMLAMAKSAIANSGHNIINYYSAEKRAKLTTTNQAVEVSLDAMQDVAGDSYEYTALVYSDVWDKGLSEMEARVSVDSLLAKTADSPPRNLFLRVLAGRYDEGFSEYLGGDNTFYADEESFEKLLKKACCYMNITVTRGERFLRSLR